MQLTFSSSVLLLDAQILNLFLSQNTSFILTAAQGIYSPRLNFGKRWAFLITIVRGRHCRATLAPLPYHRSLAFLKSRTEKADPCYHEAEARNDAHLTFAYKYNPSQTSKQRKPSL